MSTRVASTSPLGDMKWRARNGFLMSIVLREFITAHRELVIERVRKLVMRRMPGRPSDEKLEHGVPLFLGQLADALAPNGSLPRVNMATTKTISDSAALHGHDLLALGFSLAQVVHGYGDVCQVVTELAQELGAKITVDDFHVFNRCLDDAIAGAVSAYSEQRERDISYRGSERQGMLAHELRNLLHVATLSFAAMKYGRVGINGSTAAVHERSLASLTALVERSLIEVRLEAGKSRMERLSLSEFIAEVAESAAIQAEARSIQLTVEPVDAELVIDADRELLSSALMNLLQNAFKFSTTNGNVALTTSATTNRIVLNVSDECGGLPAGRAEALFVPFSQASADRSGLGLGLSIALRAARINEGNLSVRNIPGKGCVFSIELPRPHAI